MSKVLLWCPEERRSQITPLTDALASVGVEALAAPENDASMAARAALEDSAAIVIVVDRSKDFSNFFVFQLGVAFMLGKEIVTVRYAHEPIDHLLSTFGKLRIFDANQMSPRVLAQEIAGIADAFTPRDLRTPVIPPVRELVFISYRRDSGAAEARLLAERLKSLGYSVFLDVESIPGGPFGSTILENLYESSDVVVVLTQGCFDGIEAPGNWLFREISTALLLRAVNVVPVMTPGFEIPESGLPSEITGLFQQNGIRVTYELYDAAVDKLSMLLRAPRKHDG